MLQNLEQTNMTPAASGNGKFRLNATKEKGSSNLTPTCKKKKEPSKLGKLLLLD